MTRPRKAASGLAAVLRRAWVLGALAGLAQAALGQVALADAPPASFESRWKLTGFGTLGWVHTDSEMPWLFGRDLTQKGAAGPSSVAVDSRFALQLQGELGDHVEGVAQLVLKNRPPGAATDEALEWAFLGWRPRPDLSLRLGRTSPDLFLLADVRNVGFAYPWVRPSVEYYGWMPFSSMDGADLTVRGHTDIADWKAKLAVGKIKATMGVVQREDRLHVEGLDTVAATVTGESGGLLLKASYLRTRLRADTPPAVVPLQQALTSLQALPFEPVAGDAARLRELMAFGGATRYIALGAQYESAGWTIHAEASRVRFAQGGAGGDRGYVSLGYRWERVTWFLMGARTQPQNRAASLSGDWAAALTPFVGAAAAQQTAMLGAAAVGAVNQPRFDQSTRSAGLRWDVRDQLAIKLQFDQTQVHANGAAAWRNGSAQPNRARQVSASIDMVF